MFVRGPNPIWFMSNLTGQPLDDTYYAFFLTNDLPYLPQAVYQDPNGVNPWSDPLEFQPSSGLPNNLYFDPDATYRIEIRQGPDQTYPLIWLVQNYIVGTGEVPAIPLLTAENMITNPQFADIYFATPVTFTTAGTYTIAPGWQLILSGAGSTTITQTANDGNSDIQGNPPYYLTINNSGWTTAFLIQQFTNNGAIFGGGAASIAFSAFATSSDQTIVVSYVPSAGSPTILLPATVVDTGSFQYFANAVDIPDSTNTDTDGNAYVNIQFTLPISGIISLTNIQFAGQSTNIPDGVEIIPPIFQEQTYERTVDQEFNVYKNATVSEQKNSLLTGWNFGNNPWQFASVDPTNVAVNQYTADQTIIIQQHYVATGTGNNVSANQASVANNLGFQVQAVTANNQFAILQYIDPSTIRNYWGYKISSMVSAFLLSNYSTVVKFKMRLIYIAAYPNSLSQTDPIASWTAGGDPVAASGYTLIVPPNDPVYTMSENHLSYSFDGIVLPASSNGDMTLGILLYTTGNMNNTSTADSIVFNDISLVPNDFALPTQAETFDQTLKKCQFYFEKSYAYATAIGDPTYDDSLFFKMTYYYVSASGAGLFPSSFGFVFKNTKCQVPTVNYYSPQTGTPGQVVIGVWRNGSFVSSKEGDNPTTLWNFLVDVESTVGQVQSNTTSIYTISSSASPGDEAAMYLHYTADSRIG